MKFSAILLMLFLLEPVFAQDSYSLALKHFQYDAHTPLDIKEISVQSRAGVDVHDIIYASPAGGVVSAYLVVPNGEGIFAAILWGHWMMPNSPTANRSEFVDEAITLASAGVVSLLIDAPMVRPGFKPDADPLGPQTAEVTRQEVLDLRRALDLLLARRDVDPKRIAFVGHSFGASCGAILDAVDKRPAAFVFIGNPVAVSDMLTSDLPMIVEFRKKVGDEKIKAFLDKYGWSDPGEYTAYLGPSPAFFQYATHDEFMTVPMEQKYFDMSKGPKEIKFYDSNHALNSEARHDRYEFLRNHLALQILPAGSLERVPPTK